MKLTKSLGFKRKMAYVDYDVQYSFPLEAQDIHGDMQTLAIAGALLGNLHSAILCGDNEVAEKVREARRALYAAERVLKKTFLRDYVSRSENMELAAREREERARSGEAQAYWEKIKREFIKHVYGAEAVAEVESEESP